MQNDFIRCFIAIQIPKLIILEIEDYINNLKKISPQIRWVNAKGIHLTLKFLGEIKPDLVHEIKNNLLPIKNVVEKFKLTVNPAGCFPNENRPRVIWLGISQDKNNSLICLHQWIEEKLIPLGFEKEKRRFSPHLTLGRVKTPSNFKDIFNYLKEHPFPEHSFIVKDIILMRSKLLPTGAEYTPLEIYSIN